ncbi:MAG TPA: GNAT family N-acetyltransferase [Candidatus Limnocylindria bacterium]
MDLEIRRARPRDKRAVREAVRTIWNGHDRVPRLFDRWVTHRSGPFFVALVRGRVVGMGKLTVVSAREGWLEGGRVAPRYRRRGIATALIAHRLAYAESRGLAVLRFSTASDNTPIHRAARRFRFRRAARLAGFLADARAGKRPRPATRAELGPLRRALGRYIEFGPGWAWRELLATDIERAVAAGRAFRSDGAAAIVGAAADGTLPVLAFGGGGSAAVALLAALRAEAHARDLRNVEVYLGSAAERRAALRAGYERPWDDEAYLFERRLRAADVR